MIHPSPRPARTRVLGFLLALTMMVGPAQILAGHADGSAAESITLYLHGQATARSGTAFASGWLDETPPTSETPWVSHASGPLAGTNPNTYYDANWRWQPAGGYAFSGVYAVATWWAISAGFGPVLGHSWEVKLFSDSVLVGDFDPGTVRNYPASGTDSPIMYTAVIGPIDIVGSDFTLQIGPSALGADDGNVILHDSTTYPSSLFLGAVPADSEPPSKVIRLRAAAVTPVGVTLTWDASTDNIAVHRYDVYRDGAYAFSTRTNEGSDSGLTPLTEYAYHVVAVDPAGNEGAASKVLRVTTSGPDTTPPTISGLLAEPSASVLTVDWSTDENTTAVVEYGTTAAYGATVSAPRGTANRAFITGLVPATTYHLRVTATDDSGNTAVATLTAATSVTQTLFLANQGTAFTEFSSERNVTGDNDGRGYNLLGGVAATVNHNTGTAALPVADAYPVEAGTPGVVLDAGRDITATVYVSGAMSLPTVGTLMQPTAGIVALELSVFANGNELVGRQVVQHELIGDVDWIPYNYSFPAAIDRLSAESVRIELRAKIATTAWFYGYEGDHASRVNLPITPALPVDVIASITSPAPYYEDSALAFNAGISGGVGPFTTTWTFSDAATASGVSVTRTFAQPEFYSAVATVTDSLGNTASAGLSFRVRQLDYVGESRVVVAVIDTGVNPYHNVYRRAGIQIPYDELVNAHSGAQARPISLHLTDNYASNLENDTALFQGIGSMELVHFEDTNVFGITRKTRGLPVLDDIVTSSDNGHGTATTSTVLDVWPDALIVMGETNLNTADLREIMRWMTDQPWIDVISVSIGMQGNAPNPGAYPIPAIQRTAWGNGKVWAASAGNDPSPLVTDGLDGSPWVFSITGTQAGGRGRENLASTVYPDYASNYTVTAASNRNTEDYLRIGGTSFSTPTVAGTMAGAIHTLRRETGYAGGIENKQLVPDLGITNRDMRDALNKTAYYPDYDGYTVGLNYNGDVAVLPVVPWAQVGWGHIDGSLIGAIVDVIESGDYSLPEPPHAKGLAKIYMEQTYRSRSTYWSNSNVNRWNQLLG